MTGIRAFFCLPLPEALLGGLSRWIRDAAREEPRARWVDPRGLHVTLRFCGEISPGTVSSLDRRLSAALRECLDGLPPMTIGRADTFGRPPRVLWAGLRGAEKLGGLNALIERACRAEGLPPETKRFTPHLTLARIPAFSEARLDRLPPWTFEGGGWLPERVIFMRSALTPGGARYSPMFVYGRSR